MVGGRAAIPDLVRQKHVEQVIIAMPGVAGKLIREIVATCEAAGAQTKIVPAITDLLDGGVKISQIRDVDIEDLLRREPVRTDTAQVTALLRGRRVLVTGTFTSWKTSRPAPPPRAPIRP